MLILRAIPVCQEHNGNVCVVSASSLQSDMEDSLLLFNYGKVSP